MSASLRLFAPADYVAMCDIQNAVYSEESVTVEEVRLADDLRDPMCKHRRWMVEVEERPVAWGEYTQRIHKYHPHKFFLQLFVHPTYQNQGIGSKLYTHILEALQPFEPVQIRTQIREDQPQSVRFLQQRGFREEQRKWESRLDLTTFDLGPYLGVEQRLSEQGTVLKTLEELAIDPERDRKLYALDWQIRQDVPAPEPRRPISFELFCARFLYHPEIVPEAFIVAVHNGEYVGLSFMGAQPSSKLISTGLTGTLRSYRHMGIATALKLRGIRYAQQLGYAVLRTVNDALNVPMLSINRRMGFVKHEQLAILYFVKDC